MSSITAFISPFGHTGSSSFVSSSALRASRKRKRKILKVRLDDGISDDAMIPIRVGGNQQESEQLRLAGLSDVDRIPGGNFPHAATATEDNSDEVGDDLEPTHEQSEGSEMNQSISLKRQHLEVLTTIMHKCLSSGDYVRAGRAWGNLLRVEVKGRSMNLRKNSMWGIGAEILLRKYSPQWTKGTAEPSSKISTFSREGFERAKDYYERLILQYPHRQWAPDVVSVLHFYPAMFGLWIYQVQSEQKAAFAEVKEARSQNLDGDYTGDYDGIRKRSLLEAEQIANRLDELLSTLPYSEDSGLWRLRAMIALWIRDLCATFLDAESQGLEYLPSPGGNDSPKGARILDSVHQDDAKDIRRGHEDKAREAFEKSIEYSHPAADYE